MGLLDGAYRLPGLWGDPRERLPGGVLSNPAAPPINVQPVPMTGGVNRALPTGLDRIKSGLSTVFAGANDPRLSAEENDRARKMALIQSGLAMMAASGPSAQPVNLAQIIAAGAMSGQQAGAQGREAGLERAQQAATQAQREKMQQIVASGAGAQELRRMFQQAVASGDTESARALATVIQAAEATERDRNQPAAVDSGSYMLTGEGINPETGNAEKYLMDRRTGEVKWTGVRPIPPRAVGGSGGSASSYQYKEINGEPYNYDARTGALIPIQGAPAVRTATGANTDGARRAAGLLGVIEDANNALANYQPTDRDRLGAVPFVGNDLLSEEGQVAAQAARQLAQSYLYVVSGAQATNSEIEATAKTYLPLPSDGPAVLARKAQARRKAMQAVRSVAGMQPGAEGGAEGGAFDDLVPPSVGTGRSF